MACFLSRPLFFLFLFFTLFFPPAVLSMEEKIDQPDTAQEPESSPAAELVWPAPDTNVVGLISEDTTAMASITNYATLTELIAMISEDAMHQFGDFFKASLVQVEPFPYLWEFDHRRPSMLGITLANQMAAMLNNYTMGSRSNRDQYQPTHSRKDETMQWVQGTMQEMDGFLRIHISAGNAVGVRRSYVVNAQMSEPIYRALHTVPYRSRLHADNRNFWTK